MNKKIIAAAALVAAVLALAALLVGGKRYDIEVYMLESKPFTKQMICSGSVEADCSEYITPAQESVVSDVLVEAGQSVNEGQRLIKLANGKYITSNKSGTVIYLSVERGSSVTAGQPVAAVCEQSELRVRIKVPQSSATGITVGQKVSIKISGIEHSYSGTVQRVNKLATKQQGGSVSVDALIDFDSIDRLVSVGFSARVSIEESKNKAAVIVPLECVGSDKKGEYVYTVRDGRAYKRYFSYSDIVAGGYIVSEGLSDGEVVAAEAMTVKGHKVRIVDGES